MLINNYSISFYYKRIRNIQRIRYSSIESYIIKSMTHFRHQKFNKFYAKRQLFDVFMDDKIGISGMRRVNASMYQCCNYSFRQKSL